MRLLVMAVLQPHDVRCHFLQDAAVQASGQSFRMSHSNVLNVRKLNCFFISKKFNGMVEADFLRSLFAQSPPDHGLTLRRQKYFWDKKVSTLMCEVARAFPRVKHMTSESQTIARTRRPISKHMWLENLLLNDLALLKYTVWVTNFTTIASSSDSLLKTKDYPYWRQYKISFALTRSKHCRRSISAQIATPITRHIFFVEEWLYCVTVVLSGRQNRNSFSMTAVLAQRTCIT